MGDLNKKNEMQHMLDTLSEEDGQAQISEANMAAPWLSRRAKISMAVLMVAAACITCVAVKAGNGDTAHVDKGLDDLQGKSSWSFGGPDDYHPASWVSGAPGQYHPDHWALGALKSFKPVDWTYGLASQFHPKTWVQGSLNVYHPKDWCGGDGSYHPSGWIGGSTLQYHPVLWRTGAVDGYHPLSWIPGDFTTYHPPNWVSGLLDNYHPADWVQGDLKFYHPCASSSGDPLAEFKKAFSVDSAEELLALHEAGAPINHLLNLDEPQFMALLWQSKESER